MTKTNAYTLLCTVIRAVVIWVAASSLVGLPAMWMSLRYQEWGEASNAPFLIAAAVVFVLLALAWLFADKLARLALARPQEQVFDSEVPPRMWLGLAISAIGAWFLFRGLSDTLYLLTRWFLLARANINVWDTANGPPEWMQQVLTTALEMALAIAFLLRGQGIARLVHRWRYGQLPDAAAD
jgi:hypothetical protein